MSNLRRTLEAIEANPKHWDQSFWHCGTSHCFAGFAEMLRHGLRVDCDEPPAECEMFAQSAFGDFLYLESTEDTRNWLGLDEAQWNAITHPCNTLDAIRRIVAEIESTSLAEPVSEGSHGYGYRGR